jgi:hypothetical protein
MIHFVGEAKVKRSKGNLMTLYVATHVFNDVPMAPMKITKEFSYKASH